MLFLDIHPDAAAQMSVDELLPSVIDGNGAITAAETRPVSAQSFNREGIVEDDVDQFLWKQDGRIARERNEQLYVCILFVPLFNDFTQSNINVSDLLV